ncbi:LysM peptidoglycan-binding domain-containing protein [Corallococcus sp. BB11-1]|uniref:LysM peptidoglycan-binding domain-containing protein n=1 Tax=Corallococcus sp. BB11-1 TaxID=2996783 RepID=UPI0010D42889|nr:LysM peptidoglycan-binding domain-containing protein [Corallococcus sp. BB11-1]MCY1031022.1 LysM peptidoglycan-binding domain-containing protein [Corallococcus sp. BB11-1]RYZ44035.1 MAG: LysM peptidoglycan-binding domain-containing protein [Myxococcaceae bacterium]
MSYRIQRGDTLSALAGRFGTSVSALAKANGISNPDLIITGNSLKVPGQADSFQSGGATGGGRASSGASSSGGTFGASGAAPMGEIPSSFGGNASRLASAARSMASSMNTTGWCAKGVNRSLAAAGLNVNPLPSAYMYGNVLAKDSRFREVSLTDEQIKQLPPGAIVVTDAYNSPGNPHGHIAVSLGNGMEASDHVGRIATHGTQRVFIPV